MEDHEDSYTIYVTTPAGKMVEWDDWAGSLGHAIRHFGDNHGWAFQRRDMATKEIFFEVRR